MNTVLSKALREFTTGPLNQLIVNLGGQDGDQWEQQFKQFLRREPCWTTNHVAEAPAPATPPHEPLLELVNTIMLAATTEKFVAKDKFVAGTSPEAKVKIYGTGNNFDNWFLAGDSRIEEPIGETSLRYDKLRKASVDGPIITTLGGRESATTGLTYMYSLMKKQPNGPQSDAGPLLTNGWWNIFYVPQAVTKLTGNRFRYVDKAGETVTEEVSNSAYLFEVNGKRYVLRAVHVYWRDGGWCVSAGSVESSFGWLADDQVFSRNSFGTPGQGPA